MSLKFLKYFFDNSYLKYGLILLGLGLTSYPIIELTRQQGNIELSLAATVAVIIINVFAFVQFILFLTEYFGLGRKKRKALRR